MSDFKWKLSRPGIELEFETGSISECIGLLQEEGTQIQTIFGWTPGGAGQGQQADAPAPAPAPEKKRGRPAKATVEAVAPDPLPVPTAATPTAAAMPMPSPIAPPAAPIAPPAAAPAELTKQVQQAVAAGGIPAFLDASATPAAPPPPPPPLPVTAAPPIAPTVAAPPPVGVLGPKVVAALDKHREGKPDGGQALADWLADSGLTIKGKSYDDACRAVLMISDEKLKGVAAMLGVA